VIMIVSMPMSMMMLAMMMMVMLMIFAMAIIRYFLDGNGSAGVAAAGGTHKMIFYSGLIDQVMVIAFTRSSFPCCI
jgi:hypothetical protein